MEMLTNGILLSFVALTYGAVILNSRTYELSIIHMNDFHARFEEINMKLQSCNENETECIGGYSRLYSTINKLKEERPDSIILDAGDSFQGTLWYTLYKWNATQHFITKIPFDAHTLGNHEFDDKITGLVPYLECLKAPVVVANIDDRDEPTLRGLYKKSVVIERHGIRIGVIGVIISSTNRMSNTGKLRFLDESESVNNEAKRLVAEEHVDTIIVLSHCGYELDKIIARNAAPKIGLIVGGHSHSLLYTGTPPGNVVPDGEYPTIIKQNDGRKVLIVQALAYTLFLGQLLVRYDSQGDVISWSGKPLLMDGAVPQDLDINREILEWQSAVDEYERKIVGEASVHLDGSSCRTNECNLGSLLTDSMIYAYRTPDSKTSWTNVAIALINPGGIRSSIKVGNITLGNILEVQPFQNTIDIAELQGRYLLEALEFAATPAYLSGRGLLQVSGIHAVYNISNEVGSRLQSAKVRCSECIEPTFEDIALDKYYRIACNNFLMQGKDGYGMISANIINHKFGEIDVEVVKRYIEDQSPITTITEGRITLLQ